MRPFSTILKTRLSALLDLMSLLMTLLTPLDPKPVMLINSYLLTNPVGTSSAPVRERYSRIVFPTLLRLGALIVV